MSETKVVLHNRRDWNDQSRRAVLQTFVDSGLSPSAFARKSGLVRISLERWTRTYGLPAPTFNLQDVAQGVAQIRDRLEPEWGFKPNSLEVIRYLVQKELAA